MKNVRIDDVIVARSDATAAEPLPDGLAKRLYNEPIILRDDMVLVDGLRRLLWHRAQGHETVPAVTVQTFLEAMQALTPFHEGRRLDPLRVWNFTSVLHDMEREWHKSKRTGGWTKGHGNGPRVKTWSGKVFETSSRLQYRTALNVPTHTLQSTLFMYRRAEAGDQRAQELVAHAERGDYTIQQANRIYLHPNSLGGHVTDTAEQQRILERGVLGIQAQVTGLQKLGHPLSAPVEDIAKALDGLVTARTSVTQLIRGLRNILKEKMDG